MYWQPMDADKSVRLISFPAVGLDPWWLCSFRCLVVAETTECKNGPEVNILCHIRGINSTLPFSMNGTRNFSIRTGSTATTAYMTFSVCMKHTTWPFSKLLFLKLLHLWWASALNWNPFWCVKQMDGNKLQAQKQRTQVTCSVSTKALWDTQTCKNIQSKMQTQLGLTHTHSLTPPHLCAL